jgi:tRNA (guanine37-N1)-methyltransferase
MVITILTLFPTMFESPFASSIISRAIKQKIVTIRYINIRDFSEDKYKTVDGHPYGGGVGMIMKVDVADRAIAYAKSLYPKQNPFVVLLDPQGKQYKQADAQLLSGYEYLIFFCAHYEGIDQRIRTLVDREFSIGDYILTGGEIPAMVMIDSIVRLIPGVLGKPESPKNESFSDPNLLEGSQYTNPQAYKGMDVPPILLSGNHKKIREWKKEEAIKTTKLQRPGLFRE